MKKTFLSFLLAVIAQLSFAQLSITTNLRQDAVWDAKKENWDVNNSDASGTKFEFNRELTSFKHTTATITSNYEILDYTYNDTTTTYKMNVKSDAGNEYEMIIDGKNNCVAFFYWRNKDYILVRHTIKDTFFKE